MSSLPQKLLTSAEYLEIERRAEYKSEFFGGEMFAMAGASKEHSMVNVNLTAEIHFAAKGGPCRAFDSDMRVKVSSTGLYTYPDIAITCDQAEFEDEHMDTLLNPRIIVEILSNSTEQYDRGKKFEHYRQIDSLQEYILVAQDRPLIERFVRLPSGEWAMREFKNLEQNFAFQSVAIEIPMADIYRDVEF